MQKPYQITDAVIKAHQLRKSFGDFVAVNSVDFNVFAGECVGVLGPNGAGKTTTLRMLLGNTLPDKGTLSVLGYSIPKQATKMRRYLGVVPQHDNLDPDFTVRENLITYATYFGLRNHNLEKYLDELIAFAALENKIDAKIPTLSGGMRRRLILARALINRPRLLILDEPTTGLDPQARQFIWQRLRSLKSQGTTLVLTTHYMDEAERLCDRILVMEKGSIIAEGKPRDLIANHIEPHVLEIYGDEIDSWDKKHQLHSGERIEHVGETIFCYCQDEKTILQELEQWPNLQCLRRPANLEDVFIKLTGRELRDE